jgi:hypothetical protein
LSRPAGRLFAGITRDRLADKIGPRAAAGVYNMSFKYYDANGQLVVKPKAEYERDFLSDPLTLIGQIRRPVA